MSQAEQFCKLE